MQRFLRLLGAALCGVLLYAGLAQSSELGQTFTFGIVPQQSASRSAEEWGPLLAELSLHTGLSFRFATAPSIPVFEQRLGRGEYDFAYMNPYHYVVFHRVSGYRALAKEQAKMLKGIIVVRKDANVRALPDLAGQEVAFPAPAAFAASILTQAEFERQRVKITPRYVSSHESVYRAVAAGLYPAGGGIPRTLEAAPDAVRGQLRVLVQTAQYTPHAIASAPRVSPEIVERVQQALVSMSSTERGRQILRGLTFSGIMRAEDEAWNDIRALDLKMLERLGTP
ncbi:phosphate/phosphite/phosphonate ABC transporter substrate-binding protein [Ferriphaselus sp. R-1]|uniref:phosphate/phosphite/phosphonate ABC transporter substrate-binding protein n=1 Tax=Ferriphaselus sp. R-1 TaxID=1485544 RepID=UPI001F2E9AFA|nr:phosphate/phosphite/phosphonate ABC transporter substrate-binding protein [Ferriphaselus sp. R-1]